jgi:cell filamentation protein
MKYTSPDSQNETLPNLLNLESAEDISKSEFEGFLKAEILLTESLTSQTKFTVDYILKLHKLALEHLYSFAGKFRDVNLSKGGFPFAAAKFLPESLAAFEKELLSTLPNTYSDKDDLIQDIAKVHGELLFIHPFREGNGRTARVLANLMCRKEGYGSLQFDKIGEKEFEGYVQAVQKSTEKEYGKMTEFIQSIFPE